ncbi:tetratricopeptide repeat protein [Pleurocapsa sp. PCC 7319]|uniref:tetratricopeptide repeat protein n=1 Tax=Pleurocapsa sp. PCC 7319 TaxID=118161 RepID=UPI000346A54B|nr:tetratricopeptide repeat protein [Pleurocapsa sp. PCC 7319]
MNIVQDNYQSKLSQLTLQNNQGELINLERPIICGYVDCKNTTEIDIFALAATKLPNFQFVLLLTFRQNIFDTKYILERSNNLYIIARAIDVECFLQFIDLFTILSGDQSPDFLRNNTVDLAIPVLYFGQDGQNSKLLGDSNAYVIAGQANLDLFVLFIKRFFARNNDVVCEFQLVTQKSHVTAIQREEKMIEEQTVVDYSSHAAGLQERGEIEAAIQYYRQALNRDPQQPLWVFSNLAECLESQGHFEQAIEIVQAGLKMYPEAASLYRFLGVVQDRKGNVLDVIVNYQKAIELDQNQPFWVYCVLADYYQLQGKLHESTLISLQGIKLYPQQADMYRCLGVIQDRQGNIEETIDSYLKAIELNPQQPFWVYCALIERLNHLDRAEEAIAVGQQGLKQYPEQAEIYYHLGAAQDKNKDIAGVTDSYCQAVKLNPQQPVHLYLTLIERLLAQDKIELAIKLVNQATKLYPEQVDSFRSCYHKILEIRPNDLLLFVNLVKALRDSNELGEAVSVCQKGLLIYPERQELRDHLEQIFQQSPSLNQSQNNEGSSYAPISLVLTPLSNWLAQYKLGDKLQAQGKLEEAVEAYQQSIIRNPGYSWSYHNLGDVQLKLGRWEDAIVSYQRAIELNPDYFWSNYNLGVAFNNSGRWSEAIALYRRSIDLNPSLNLPYRALKDSLLKRWNGMLAQGDILLKQKERAEASAIFRQAIRLFREFSYVPQLDGAKEIPQKPSVVLVVDDHLSQCLRYRVEQKIEQLEHAGIAVQYFPWRDVKLAKSALHFCHAVIFYRVPALPDLIETIEYAKAINKVVFYEIDDLIFDEKEYPDPIESYGGQVSEDQYRGLLRGTTLFNEAMALCDYGIASTPALAKHIEQVVAKKTCFVHRNALDSLNSEFIQLNIPKIKRDYVSIFYGSGTKAHNADFEKLVAPAIAKILEQYPQVRLTLMGYLTLPKILIPYQEQIDRINLIRDVAVYWEFLRQADINIAVLLPTPVNNCKSELKWFEAGCLGVPSIVSNTQTYEEILTDGVDALIASNTNEWYVKLKSLVTNSQLRHKIAKAAYNRVWREYNIPVMADNIKSIVMAGIELETKAGKLKPRTTKKKLLIVNVFYPPQSIGGATRIVKDNVDVLKANYGDEYEISVFTTDDGNPHPYEILEYSYEGVNVTKVSSPMMEGMDWQCENPKMYEIFTHYLEFNQPDLIHFHCIQRLTGSVLEAAADLNVPYLVTVHDAWWISDYQFLVNDKGIECNYQQNDPVVTANDTKDIVSSLKRKRYLKQRLEQASAVLAVSEAFTEIYRRNGIVKIQPNRNGIIPQPCLARKPSPSGKVRLAHIGGMAAHKGYFLFQKAVKTAQLENCEVVVISHGQVEGSVNHDLWCTTPVQFIAKIPQTKIYEFYSTIDVLMAPSMWPESFGLVTREAAAAGVWVVASNKGALSEDLIPGENGDVFNPDNIEELIGILQKIDREPQKYQQLLHQNIPIRTTKKQVDELLKIYQNII